MDPKALADGLDPNKITLDELGRVIIDDVSTLDLISGGEGGPDEPVDATNGVRCSGKPDDTNLVFCK